jgi:hypothetical protein
MARTQGKALSTLHAEMPLKTEARCHICQSSARTTVDKLLAAQLSYKSIAEELVLHEDFRDKNLDSVRKNVERHSKAHVDIRSKAVREVVERRAKEQGILLDSAEGQITSSRALLDLIVSRGTEQLALDPDSRVRFADAIEAAKMIEDAQRTEYQARLEVLERQVWAISEAVKWGWGRAGLSLQAVIECAGWLFDNPDKTPKDYEDELHAKTIEFPKELATSEV